MKGTSKPSRPSLTPLFDAAALSGTGAGLVLSRPPDLILAAVLMLAACALVWQVIEGYVWPLLPPAGRWRRRGVRRFLSFAGFLLLAYGLGLLAPLLPPLSLFILSGLLAVSALMLRLRRLPVA
jgi:hypothetical protein